MRQIENILNPLNYLLTLVHDYSALAYLILFSAAFLESSSILFSWLPVQTLIFVVGMLCQKGEFNLWILLAGFCSLTTIGEFLKFFLNYHRLHEKESTFIHSIRVFLKRDFKLTNFVMFFHRLLPAYGLLVPLAAAENHFPLKQFVRDTILANFLWVNLTFFLGYFLGKNQFVNHYATLLIIAVALLPALADRLWQKR
ncbi:DedA family protein [Oenococcus sicerae]|uniref:DedA family protein n=2 Tax=Oenococcus sicerae TaxID=2203724 RepID=UPI0039EAA0B3